MPASPIHAVHEDLGARFTDFGGWSMPVQYEGVLDEHRAVRSDVGVFDVSHLGRFEVAGPGSTELLRRQLCNDISTIDPGRAQYTMALNARGGVEDDIIVWRLEHERYWVMPNGTNSTEIENRFISDAPEGVTVTDIRMATALFAVQGPSSSGVVSSVVSEMPGRFRVVETSFGDTSVVAAGTGYTGERGAEICVPLERATAVWSALVAEGAVPCGLGARDTLRLEMGYPLWGQDLSETISPLEAGLGWVVDWNHDFVGKTALEAQRGNLAKRMVAFTTEGRAIPRNGYRVESDSGSGEVTSGNFSPTLEHGIGLAYVSPPPSKDESISVIIRGKSVPATRTKLPFVER
ncbi:MAG: glycine cleavage system aminomethyltransferase GcvT [Acidimicrobiia bacterium]